MQRVRFVLNLSHVGLEIDAYSREIGVVEPGLAEAEENGAFSDCLRPNYYDFKGLGFYILVGVVHIVMLNLRINVNLIQNQNLINCLSMINKKLVLEIF